MIKKTKGNLLESSAEALVNTVNLQGVMGKGIALQFKKAFPYNYKEYKKACVESNIGIGKLHYTIDETLHGGKKVIFNFPTKTSWRKPSEYAYIEKGLQDLVRLIEELKIESIAIPPLGSGNGGLKWSNVLSLLYKYLDPLEVLVEIYEPSKEIETALIIEKVKLTPARALLLTCLYEIVRNGNDVSEFAAEKCAYFLQRFGCEDEFNLSFSPEVYGPYSGRVRFILNKLNGAYLSGYYDMNLGPFDEIGIKVDSRKEIEDYLLHYGNKNLKLIADKTCEFLGSFSSNFGLELLSSIDYIISNTGKNDIDSVVAAINEWSPRKADLFNNNAYFTLAVDHLTRFGLIN